MEENPKRRRKHHCKHCGGSHMTKNHNRHSRGNPGVAPMSYHDMNNSIVWGNPDEDGNVGRLSPYQNPDFMRTLTSGSAITQDVGVLDIVAGGVGFGFNSWLVKNLNLAGGASILASAIVPVITGALVSMIGGAGEHLGSSVFLGGEIEMFAKLLGKVDKSHMLPVASLHESGSDWVLASGAPVLTQLTGGTAKAAAGNLIDHRDIRMPTQTMRPITRRMDLSRN